MTAPLNLGNSPLQFIAESNNATAIFLGVIFGLFVLLLIFSGRGNTGGNRVASLSGRKRILRRNARKFGLDRSQTSLLTKAMVETDLSFPDRIFQSPRLLDSMLKHLINSLENEDVPTERKTAISSNVYDIKRKVLNNAKHSTDLTNLASILRAGQEVTIFSKVAPAMSSIIVGKIKSHIILEAPVRDTSAVKYKPGTELKIRINTRGDKVYSFMSRLRQYKKVEDKDTMLIDHASKVEVDQLRKDLRRPTKISALFYIARIISDGSGRKGSKKLVTNNAHKNSGIIENISRGGCALLTRLPLEAGSIIKLHFSLSDTKNRIERNEDDNISLIAKVWRSDKRDSGGFVNRIGFTRASTEHLNRIQGYVFGYHSQ